MSWQNTSTMIHRNQALFYALILSLTLCFVLAFVSWGAEGTGHLAGSCQDGRDVKHHTGLPSQSW